MLIEQDSQVSIVDNVYWKKLSILVAVWLIILLLHRQGHFPSFLQDYTATCSAAYWTVTLLQIPVAVGASGYQAVCLYKGWRVVESKGGAGISWRVHQLILCCFCGILAGIVGGLLGLGGGFIIGPLLLELGIPPQQYFP
ncbi:UNVERIFIED_CONTAM: Sulfite exporter TauE/SafE family protein 3 [Sesamum radiatum]|uniref:Sulfite exporter TauE/SafE family protein 3 n=1 Tax=Sesamum radiatum TaxID=300843 RepID=A0AAW2PG02_SESRA